MEELLELKHLLHAGRVDEALHLVNELEEMSLSDKINKIDSYGVILLTHLIKQSAEKRSTRWETSIENAVREINKINKRRKAGGYFLSEAELLDVLEDGYSVALKKAAIEAFEGRYETEELAAMVSGKQFYPKQWSK